MARHFAWSAESVSSLLQKPNVSIELLNNMYLIVMKALDTLISPS